MLMLALALFSLAAPVDPVPPLTRSALHGDTNAIATLRAMGQPGLDALVTLRRSLSSVPPIFTGPQIPEVKAWEALVDAVAKQRYASASGLYWYTDFEAAKAEAQRQKKPILSLRLLGQLDQDLSCANSRFFRTVLYPDPAIAKALHDGYILHWQSVREVPKITIDFGEGRTLVRTITGNSLHYIMTPAGEITEMMPGLVAPDTFHAWLDASGPLTMRIARAPKQARSAAIRAHLRQALTARLASWKAALSLIGIETPNELEALAERSDDTTLARLGRLGKFRISPEARALVGPMMGRPNPINGLLAERAMPLAIGKSSGESPTLRQLRPVEGRLAQDDAKNQYELKARMLTLALSDALIGDEAAFTAAVYANVFFTPLHDPWMGLAPADVFTGLPPEVEKPSSN